MALFHGFFLPGDWGQSGFLRQGAKSRKHITLGYTARWLLQHCAFTLSLHRALDLENCFPVLDSGISLSGERK